MLTREDLVDEAETIRELTEDEDVCGLLDELIENLRNLGGINDPVAATAPSGARNSSAYECEDILPVGRLRHSRYQTWTPEQGREFAIEVLEHARGGWVVPLWYAEQHYDSAAAIRYFRGILSREFKALFDEGRVERGNTGKRGARLKYRLRKEIA